MSPSIAVIKRKRSVSVPKKALEYTEQDIAIVKGNQYDFPTPEPEKPNRHLEDWYITEQNSTSKLPIRQNLETIWCSSFPLSGTKTSSTSTIASHSVAKRASTQYCLHGNLVSPSKKQKLDPFPVQIQFSGQWSIERQSLLRGIWVETPRASYWLKRPSSKAITYKVIITIQGGHNHTHFPCCFATLPSQETVHLELRAKFGLISNLCDALYFDDSPDSLELLKRHSNQTPQILYEELKPNAELIAMNPQCLSDEPFDYQLLQLFPSFVKFHLSGFHPLMPDNCVFLKHLAEQEPTACHNVTSQDLLESALNAEQRGGRHPWGELLTSQDNGDHNDDDDVKDSNASSAFPAPRNPNWVYYARLENVASSRMNQKNQQQMQKTNTTSSRDAFKANIAVPVAVKDKSKAFLDTSSQEMYSKPSQIDFTNATPSSNSTREESRKGNLTKDEDKMSIEKVETKTTVFEPQKKKKSRSSRFRKLVDSDEDDDDNQWNDDSIMQEIETPQDLQQKLQISTIFESVTFQSQRMIEALNDMKCYLKNYDGEGLCTTMMEVRRSGYCFKSNESAETFIAEKMRDATTMRSWEYKVLVALVITGTHKDLETNDPKALSGFERVIFGKPKGRHHLAGDNGIKIFCETWRSEAMSLLEDFEKSSEATQANAHPLKSSLIAELLVEFCVFSSKCKILKSKKALDTIKDPHKYGVDFLDGLEKTTEILDKLQNRQLIHSHLSAMNRLRSILAKENHEKGLDAGKVDTEPSPDEAPSQSTTSGSSTPQEGPMIDYAKAGQDARLKRLRSKTAGTTFDNANISSGDNRSVNTFRCPQTAAHVLAKAQRGAVKSVWGTSSWGGSAEADSRSTASEDDALICAWRSSSSKKSYLVWGNTSDAAPRKKVSAPEDCVPNNKNETNDDFSSRLEDRSHIGIALNHHRQDRRGRGADRNSPALQEGWRNELGAVTTKRVLAYCNDQTKTQRSISAGSCPVPGTGFVSSKVGLDAIENHGSPAHRIAVTELHRQVLPTPKALPDSQINSLPSLGRGRGRAMTTPAWMTNPQLNQNL